VSATFHGKLTGQSTDASRCFAGDNALGDSRVAIAPFALDVKSFGVLTHHQQIDIGA
jgi:hypothetical protein